MKNKIIKSLGLLFLSLCIFMPLNGSAKTIKDFRNDLQSLKNEKATALANKTKTEADIAAANREIESITLKIEKATKDQEDLEVEIKRLEKEIVNKKAQIKELVAFFQVSDSENFYLKYLFGADNFEDFIFRFSVVEQVTTRSDELVKEMNNLILENNKKIKELDAKKGELRDFNQQVQNRLAKLGTEKTKYNTLSLDIDSQIKAVQKQIDYYVELKCDETIDLSKCAAASSVPYDYGFNKPLTKGYVSDEYGMRWHPTQHVWKMHNGTDLAGNSEGTAIYAPAAGKVVDLMYRYYCGGNIMVINHNIDGTYYTTRYLHMLSFSAKVGDIVQKGQKIGTVGGGPQTFSYETCSTGAHLHFEMAKGHYYGSGSNSYSSYSTYLTKLINPRDLLYFPAYGVRWS